MRERLRKIFRSRWFKAAVILFVIAVGFVLYSNYTITASAEGRTWSDVDKVPFNKVALVLGANKSSRYGGENLYFKYRIEAAAELFKAGKVKHIIVSGDNHIESYDEATDMRDALMKLGIPDSCITLDYAGFRTLDSVVRCREVFGQDSITIVSQEFHNQRAVYIADYYGIHAIGFNAREVSNKYSFRTKLREYFAKAKAVLDLYVLKTSPKFLGEKIEIKIP